MSSTSEDAPSVAASRVETIINAPPVGDNVDFAENFVDNYELDGEQADDYTLYQKMVHYCGGGIVSEHWAACKVVLVFHAGVSVSKLSTMTRAVKEAATLQLYTSAIAELDEVHFGDGARLFFSRSFQKKDEPVTGLSLYRYFLDSRSKMRNHVMPLFPKDFVTMKSGKGFHESCNDVYTKAYRDEQSLLKSSVTKFVHRSSRKQRLMPWFLLICGSIAKPLGYSDCASKFFAVVLTLLQRLRTS